MQRGFLFQESVDHIKGHIIVMSKTCNGIELFVNGSRRGEYAMETSHVN